MNRIQTSIASALSDQDLTEIFRECEQYWETGILADAKVLNIARSIKQEFQLPLATSQLQELVINTCLKEIGRRWVRQNQT